MKAFNPETGEIDLDISFPSFEYELYSIICTKCNVYVGGGYSGHDLPKPKIDKYCTCPSCGTQKDLKLVFEE